MLKTKLGVSMALALCVPAVAQAKLPTHQHVRRYLQAYHAVRHQFGAQAVGCNLIERKGSCHTKASDAAVIRSLSVLGRDLAPHPVVTTSSVSVVQPTSQTTTSTAPAAGYTSASSSSLEACIISRESGGNAQAVNPNGHYGIAQWDVATWQSQGGGKYSSTPLGASKGQQIAVLNGALANGQSGAWTPYDGC